MIDLLLITWVMVVLFLISLVLNAFSFFRYTQLKKQLKERKPSIELDEFISDLIDGSGVVKITRINPHDIFLRSPRARR